MGDEDEKPGQYSLKWILWQVFLVGLACALAGIALNAVEVSEPPALIVIFGLISICGAIVGGFFHQFLRGAVIGAVIAGPVSPVVILYYMMRFN